MKKLLTSIAALAILAITSVALMGSENNSAADSRNTSGKYQVAAHVVAFENKLPDPMLLDVIHYDFGEINSTFDGITVQHPENLKKIVALKEQNPDLKVVLTIGGAGKGGFSPMAASSKLRKAFAKDCLAKVKEYGLDGIDLDWEFPTLDIAGQKGSPQDPANYVKVVKELRKQLGKDKLITYYSNNRALWIDIAGMMPYVDYVMASGYNLGMPPQHQSNLYRSELFSEWSVADVVRKHMALGVPASKLMIGLPFFARSVSGYGASDYEEYKDFPKYFSECEERWDDASKASYYTDSTGRIVATFDSPRALRLKCDMIKNQGLAGAFYWNYWGDDANHPLARLVRTNLPSSSE